MATFKELYEGGKKKDSERSTSGTAKTGGSTFKELYESRNLPLKAREWTEKASSVLNSANDFYKSRPKGYQNKDDYQKYKEGIAAQLEELKSSSQYAKDYANSIQDSKERQAYNSYIIDVEKAIRDLNGDLRGQYDYWSQFKDADDYETQIAQAKEAQEYADKYNKKKAEVNETWDDEFGLKRTFLRTRASANAALGSWNEAMFKGLDFFVPDALDPLDGIKKAKDYYTKANEEAQLEAQVLNDRSGAAGWLQQNLVQPTLRAVPQALLAMFSGGAGAAAGTGTGIAGTGYTAAAQAMIKNPGYWLSAVDIAGNTYDEAKKNGASELEATLMTLANSAAGAAIEVGGGIEGVGDNKFSFKTLLKSGYEEGMEEVYQGATEGVLAKGFYDHDKKWVSLKDEDAIISPLRAAKEFGGGFAVGGILGGSNAAINTVIQSGADYLSGKKVNSKPNVQAMIEVATKLNPESQAFQLAAAAEEKGGEISNKEAAELYRETLKQQAIESATKKQYFDGARNFEELEDMHTQVIKNADASEMDDIQAEYEKVAINFAIAQLSKTTSDEQNTQQDQIPQAEEIIQNNPAVVENKAIPEDNIQEQQEPQVMPVQEPTKITENIQENMKVTEPPVENIEQEETSTKAKVDVKRIDAIGQDGKMDLVINDGAESETVDINDIELTGVNEILPYLTDVKADEANTIFNLYQRPQSGISGCIGTK